MLDEYLEGYRDPQAYDAIEEGYDEDRPLTEQWARKLGGPLLDLVCGTGTMAIHLARFGYQVTGVDLVPEMIRWAEQKSVESSTQSTLGGNGFLSTRIHAGAARAEVV